MSRHKVKMKVEKVPGPGEILQSKYLRKLKMTQRELANHLNVEVKSINRLINGRTRLTPELAMKLAAAFNTSPHFWLEQQAKFEAWRLSKSMRESLPQPLRPVV